MHVLFQMVFYLEAVKPINLLEKELVENHKLQAVISMPSGVFKPYAGVSTAVLVFTKTGAGGTGNVWFYDMKADQQYPREGPVHAQMDLVTTLLFLMEKHSRRIEMFSAAVK